MDEGNTTKGMEEGKTYKGMDEDKSQPWVLGIDEAGRGPVLGPMTYGCAFYPISRQKDVEDLKFDDSKQLSEAKRLKMFEDIKNANFIGWYVDVISPTKISTNMLSSSSTSLNELSYTSAMGLIQRVLDAGYNITEAYLDAVGDCYRYTTRLEEHFSKYGIRFTVCPKADAIYKSTSAASICAKCIRDAVVEDWKFPENLNFTREFGSGYPADVRVKMWLEKHIDPVFGFPNFARFSWETARSIIEKKCCSVKYQDEISRGGLDKFGFGNNASKRHKFYKSRNMEACPEVFS